MTVTADQSIASFLLMESEETIFPVIEEPPCSDVVNDARALEQPHSLAVQLRYSKGDVSSGEVAMNGIECCGSRAVEMGNRPRIQRAPQY